MISSIYVVLFLVCFHALVAEHIYRIKMENLNPEGIEYHPKTGILLGSFGLGGVFKFKENNGQVSVDRFSDQMVEGRGTVGLAVDKKEMRCWVCYIDAPTALGPTGPATTGVYIIDLNNGRMIKEYPMQSMKTPGLNMFINDVTLDSQGVAYVSDSFGGQILRADPASNTSSVFVRSDLFFTDGFGLNGLVYHPNNYLLTIVYNTGMLFRVDLETKLVQKVEIMDFNGTSADEMLQGGDGLYFWGRKRLVVVSGLTSWRLVELRSFDDWKTARFTRVAPLEAGATTVRVVGNKTPYVSHGNFTVSPNEYFAVTKAQLEQI
jgi:sugar lactone lactonase YvrE